MLNIMSSLNIPNDFDALLQRQKSVFTTIAKGLGGQIVIMGTGELGRVMGERLQQFPVTIKCFCDNNPKKQGSTFLGRPTLSVAEAVQQFNGHAVFVVAIFHSSAGQEQLKKLGCEHVVTAPVLCRHFGPPMVPFASIDLPTAINKNRPDIARCASLWADDKSRDVYQQILSWFMAPDQTTFPDHDPESDLYYPPDLWRLNPQEHFVDCGAFDGDSLLFLIKKTGSKFGAATAYEPDPKNFKALQENIAAQPLAVRQKIKMINAAVGAKRGVVHFSVSGTAASAVAAAGTLPVDCLALDDELRDVHPTYIKMDLEGYELEALAGAAKLMASHAPILAITCYHKIEHLWQIPLLIHSQQPSYRLYLRRYAEDCWETVCYAVPPDRQVS
jgi:FkbM family methyltransferase